MAKNKQQKMNATTDYQQMQENIRKAKGNPNKNIHHKKNNSNYHGYDGSINESKKEQTPAKPKTPMWVKLSLGVAFGVLLAMLILINSVWKGNQIASNATALVTGIACLLVYYSRRFSGKPETTFFKVLGVILVIMGLFYGVMGLYGLYLNLF